MAKGAACRNPARRAAASCFLRWSRCRSRWSRCRSSRSLRRFHRSRSRSTRFSSSRSRSIARSCSPMWESPGPCSAGGRCRGTTRLCHTPENSTSTNFWISGGVTYPAKRRLLGEPFFWASTISVADIVGAVRGPCQVARLAGLEPRRTQSGGTSDDAARWRGSQLRRHPSATAPACRRRPRGRTSSSASCPAHPVETRPRPHARRLSE